MKPNLDAYDELDKALDEKRYWMEVMLLHHIAREVTGGDFERIRAFTFRYSLLKEHERGGPYSPYTHHNCVRLDDDTVLPIPLVPRPEPPSWVKVNLKVTL